ncbi:toxin-antitoxin system, toxin component, Txe/YoeB family [Xenococcus sp. PCC 7305]|uniref:Txe/YoeB family addiction module toxin n=1 Tax=Xenococcus sp. PCC 7305 TaxID=102125 RepID=UPI0002AC8447|nr:Txe/YoeB family addiction module toxin [Xenococcus sp. PCC 7305]ELS05027.1 toxin-antitoxin system, toxin component, Txe/YoeB family [Xenococcus sp. PCC 7305]
MNDRVVIFDAQFRDDLRWWARKDRKICGLRSRSLRDRVLDLVEATIADPIKGIGKPEKLKYLPGSRWSRRITQEHRLVYQISDDKLIFLQCRYHY